MGRRAGWSFWKIGVAAVMGMAVAMAVAACTTVSKPPPCPASPVHEGAVGRQDVATAPWIVAEPDSAGIFAYFMAGLPKAGPGSPVRFIVDSARRGESLELLALNTSNHEDFVHITLPRDEAISTDYAGLIQIPAAGCWELDVKTGTLSGKLTLAVGE